MMVYRFSLFLALILCALQKIASACPPPTRPNIVIIFMDDMGYGDPECYNGFQYRTPHINKLAAEGMRFTNFYAAQAVCTASRAGLLTGCYPNRLGMWGAFFPWTNIALNPKETTIASALQEAGYQTGMVGKWHLGAEPPYWPLSYGFQEYYGVPYSNDMWPMNDNGKPENDSTSLRYHCPKLPLVEGNKVVRHITTLEEQAQLTTYYTQKATEFIREKKSEPFFLYVAHSMPHVPIAASEKFRGKSKRGLYGDVMMELDWSVGEIMNTLKNLGLDRNTLVVFTSDNGPWLTYGNHAGNTGGLREGKGTTWEGGQRVPCIVRWPGKIDEGSICHKISATIDLLPTIAEISGAKKPLRAIDGVSILPLLMGEEDANPRSEFVYYYHQNNLEAIRKDNWKLVFPHESVTYYNIPRGKDGLRGKWATMKVEAALYDLNTDPGETTDLSSEYPEKIKELTSVADGYRKKLGDNLTKTTCGECRAPATFSPTVKTPAMLKTK